METKGNIVGEAAGASLFVGRFLHSLDPKRRLTIPSDWRGVAGPAEKLFVLPGVRHPCLMVYPAREIAHRLERLRQRSVADDRGRQMARVLGSRSELLACDAQGRIRIKDELLAFAELREQVVLAGTFDGFELWNPATWERVVGTTDQTELLEATKYVEF